MNVNLGIWSVLTKVAAGLVIVALLLLIGMKFLPLLQQNERMRADIMRLQTQLQIEEAKSKQLQAQIDELRNDPNAVERLAREKLGYAKPGETVIHFEPATNAPPR
ncbi:MAG TPA: septum formation initiator family protein [Candidatus Limnocylindrales bacterium]|nr:septum formation initiator family protein [Candidatus Limnocylindrales bacterium]